VLQIILPLCQYHFRCKTECSHARSCARSYARTRLHLHVAGLRRDQPWHRGGLNLHAGGGQRAQNCGRTTHAVSRAVPSVRSLRGKRHRPPARARSPPHSPHRTHTRTAPHRTAPHRTAPHRNATHRTAPALVASTNSIGVYHSLTISRGKSHSGPSPNSGDMSSRICTDKFEFDRIRSPVFGRHRWSRRSLGRRLL
jgi:hypothetical protein